MIMPNIQITNFIEDTFEVPARNAQSLLKIKIPAINSIFQKSQQDRTGPKGPNPLPITVGGGGGWVRTM